MSEVRPEWYQLRNALESGEWASATALLKNEPSLIDERNGIGETVLHLLAVENNLPAVAWLHAHGGDLNATNKFGTPLLFEVAQLGSRDLFLWLVAHGADPKKAKSDGQSLGDYLSYFEQADMIDFIKAHIGPGS